MPTPSCSVEPQASLGAECPVLTGTQPPEAPVPVVETGPQGAPCEAGTREQVPWGNAAPELPEASPLAAISTAREEESPGTARTSTPKAAGDAAVLHRHQSPQGLPLQDSNSKAAPGRADPRRCSGHRRSRRASLAGRRSLGSRRKGIIHRSVSRGISRKAAARESSSSSSCESLQPQCLPVCSQPQLWAGGAPPLGLLACSCWLLPCSSGSLPAAGSCFAAEAEGGSAGAQDGSWVTRWWKAESQEKCGLAGSSHGCGLAPQKRLDRGS